MITDAVIALAAVVYLFGFGVVAEATRQQNGQLGVKSIDAAALWPVLLLPWLGMLAVRRSRRGQQLPIVQVVRRRHR